MCLDFCLLSSSEEGSTDFHLLVVFLATIHCFKPNIYIPVKDSKIGYIQVKDSEIEGLT